MKTFPHSRAIACIAAIFLLAAPLSAQYQLYVSPAGNDGNAGTLNMPWKTVQFALDHAVPGSTIYLMGGTYSENAVVSVSGTSGHPVTLTNYNNQNAVLSGTDVTGGPLLHIGNASWFTVSGIEFSNYARNDAQGILVDGVCTHIEIRNNIIHDIHFSANAGDVPNAMTNAQPLIVYGNAATAITGLVISGNHIYNCRTGYSEALAVNGNVDGFSIDGNKVHDISNIGIDVIGHEGVCSDPANDQARNGVVRWNKTWNCISLYATSAGVYLDGARNCVVENNTSFGNGWGLEIGCESVGDSASGIVVRNNLVYDNLEGGIAAGGFDFPGSSGKVNGLSIHNNTLSNNIRGGQFSGELVITYCENTSVSCNLIYSALNSDELVSAWGNCPGLFFDHNLYYSTVTPSFTFGSNTVSTLNAWTALCGTDAHSLFTDPLFVNAAAGNFHVMSTSPAIDRGDSLYVPVASETDMDTMVRVQNGRIDIGADEYGTAVGIAVIHNATAPRILLNADHSQLEIVFAEASSAETLVSVLSLDGKIVKEAQLPAGNTNLRMDISQLARGTYIVYSSKAGTSGAKFVK